MACPGCGHNNRPGLAFCVRCRARLPRPCPVCASVAAPDDLFCGVCGADLPGTNPPATTLGRTGAAQATADGTASPDSYTPTHLAQRILAARADVTGERKMVTVLFADVTGSTELIQGLDPEAADALLKPVVQTMVDAVRRYEGTVNRVQGDGVMALFGAPLAHEDHAVRACYAALAMQEAVRRVAERARREHGVELRVRVGINSGEVVIREIGSDLHVEYDPVGPATHLAARMEQLVMPGTTRLTPATLALAEGCVQIRSLGPVPIKGLPEPVEVFELLAAGQSRTRMQVAAARGLTRFVGRQAEMDGLWRAQALTAQGHGQVLAMVGEPGVGKSRLVWEFAHSHRTADWLVLEASSVSYGKATAYLPVLDLLRSYCGVEPRDDAQRVREKLIGKVLGLDRALEPLLVPLLALLDAPTGDDSWARLDPSMRRRRILDALRRLFLRESQRQPLVLVLEDLHWVDEETQAFLDALIESLPSARLLLVVNYRPEYRHGWGSKTYYSQLRLDPLPLESAGELLDALLGNDPALTGLRALLLERTGGNPFFLEECVRALVEERALVGERGSYRLTRAIGQVRVPATVQAILASRIDRLDAADRRLVQAAAVIGKDVPFRWLTAIVDEDPEALMAGLARLQAAELLYEASLYPDLEHTFKHALTHEVAYGGVLQARRRELHGQLVDAIESEAGDRLDEQVERLAHHAVRGERWEAAVHYLRRIGERAQERAAAREALDAFEGALTALAHLPEELWTQQAAVDLRIALRNPLFVLGEHTRVLAYLREAEPIAEALGDPHRLARLHLQLCAGLFVDDHVVEAGRHGAEAAALFQSFGESGYAAVAEHYLGNIDALVGDYPAAIERYQRARAALPEETCHESFGQFLRPAVFARSVLAARLSDLGRFEEAVLAAAEAIRVGELSEHRPSLVRAVSTAGGVHLQRGDLVGAIPLLERAVALSPALDFPIFHNTLMADLGVAYAQAGRMTEARSLLAPLTTSPERLARFLRPTWIALAEIELLDGDVAAARALAECARTVFVAAGRRDEIALLRLVGEVAARQEPPDVAAAEEAFHSALGGAESLGLRPLAARCRLGLGQLYARLGRVSDARRELGTAAEAFGEMGMDSYLSAAEQALSDPGAPRDT